MHAKLGHFSCLANVKKGGDAFLSAIGLAVSFCYEFVWYAEVKLSPRMVRWCC